MKISFGPFTVKQETGELWRSGEPQRLAAQPTKLLLLLIDRAGSLVLREEIKQLLWDQETFVDFDQSLNACIRQVRSALSDSADKPIYIETVPKRGYRFIVPVTREPDEVVVPVSIVPEDAREQMYPDNLKSDSGKPPQQKRWVPIAVSACIFVIGVAAFFVYYRFVRHTRVLASAPSPEVAVRVRPSLAVLSLQNTSGQSKDAWLSTAIAEMLTNELSSDDRLRTVPRTAVAEATHDLGFAPAAYSGSKLEALHVALGSELIVQGSYTLDSNSSEGTVHLTLQAQDAATGKTRTEITETGRLNDLFALVHQSSLALRSALFAGKQQLPDDPQSLAGLSSNTEAIRLYTEGLAQMHNFDMQSARSLFERAIEADPSFALAHVQLSETWSELGYVERAKQEATEAFRLSGDLSRPQKLSIEALYRDSTDDAPRAVAIYKALETFYPDEPEWSIKLAVAQHESGQFQDAINTLEALRRRPLTPRDLVELDRDESWSYLFLGPPHVQENVAKARDMVVEGVGAARKQGGKLILARALRSECSVLLFIKPQEAATDVCSQARDTFEAVGNLDAVAAVTANLAIIQQSHGGLTEAIADVQQAEHLYHQIGNLHDEIALLANEALLNVAVGNLPTAVQQAQAVAHAKNTGTDNDYAAQGDQFMTLAYIAQGRLKEARLTSSAGLEVAGRFSGETDRRYERAIFLESLGSEDLMAGNFDEARRQWQEAILLDKALGSMTPVAELDTDLIGLDLQQGHPREDMVKSLRDDLAAFATDTQSADDQMKIHLVTARAQLALGHLPEAATSLAAARALDGKGGWVGSHLQLLLVQASIQQAQHRNAEAVATLQQEIQQAADKGFLYLQTEGEIALARLQHQTAPSSQDSARLKSLAQAASQRGYKGLASIVNDSKSSRGT